MSERRGGLGRGLGALIPSAPGRGADGSPDPESALESGSGDGSVGIEAQAPFGAYYAEVDLDAITPNPRQPRTVFDDETLGELVDSVRAVGLLQPVVVRRTDAEHYELVMGERRWRAARLAGLTAVPAIVRETSDTDLLRDALLENLHREQLNPLEEAAAYGQLLEDFGSTHEELARRVGKSRSHVSNTLRLMGLPPAVQRRVAAGVLSAGHARALLALSDPGEQDRLAQRIVAEGLSVRAVEEIVAVGDTPRPERTRRAGTRPTAPGLAELADRLADRFETRVRVDLGRSKGKIIVEFATIDDLERIVGAMAPGISTTTSLPAEDGPAEPIDVSTPSAPAPVGGSADAESDSYNPY